MNPTPGLEAFERELAYCTFCPKLCRFVCPVAEAEHRETVTPTAKATLLHLMERGALEPDRELAEPAFRCTGCGAHTRACDHEIDLSAALLEARARAARAGLAPEPLAAAADAIYAQEETLARTSREQIGEGSESSGDALVPGARALKETPKLVRHTYRVLARVLPSPPRRWAGPQCLGLPLLHAGRVDALRVQAKAVAFATTGLRRLWVMDPEDAWLLRQVYPELGVRLDQEIRLPLEALDRHLPTSWRHSEPERTDQRGRVVYHDPCYLSRRLAVLDAPRRVLRQLTGAPPTEPPFAREDSWCCGGGGGYPVLDSAAAAEVARARLDQLRRAGAKRIVTACPGCRTQLRAAIEADEGEPIEVLDLLELVGDELLDE